MLLDGPDGRMVYIEAIDRKHQQGLSDRPFQRLTIPSTLYISASDKDLKSCLDNEK